MKFLQILLIHLLPSAKSSCLSLTLQKTQHIPLSHGTFHIADNGSTIVEKLDTNLKTFTKALVTTGFHYLWNLLYPLSILPNCMEAHTFSFHKV